MKVKATKLGYIDHMRRRPGDEFIIDPKAFSKKWMVEVSKEAEKPAAAAAEAKPKGKKKDDQVI